MIKKIAFAVGIIFVVGIVLVASTIAFANTVVGKVKTSGNNHSHSISVVSSAPVISTDQQANKGDLT